MNTVTKPPTDSGTSGITVSLDRIRKKLLDLSRRNRLLNYRAGSRSLPIVDELPDEVFRMLVTGEKTIYFAPLPEPDEEDEEIGNSPDLSGGAIQPLWSIPEETALERTISAVADSGSQPAPPISAPATMQQKKSVLSGNEARQKLLELYKNKILPKFPNHERAILRKEMLEAFLRNCPTTPEGFREFIPLKFREATDPKQMEFLPEILEILGEITE